MEKETAFGYFVAWGCGIIIGIMILGLTGNICTDKDSDEDFMECKVNLSEGEYSIINGDIVLPGNSLLKCYYENKDALEVNDDE